MEKIRIKGRVTGTLTAAQRRRMKRARARIADELPDLVRRNQLAHDARTEKTFSGALRRAVHEAPSSPMKVGEKAAYAGRTSTIS